MKLVMVALLVFTATARASSPAFPICDFEEPGGVLVVDPEVGIGCPIRYVANARALGGLRFELHAPDGSLLGSGQVDDPREVFAPERRHECDGSITDGQRTLYEYSVTFHTAITGDQVWVIDDAGLAFATATYSGDTCPALELELAATECQVCAPDAAMGCADAGTGGRGLGMLLVAAACALVLARRARR